MEYSIKTNLTFYLSLFRESVTLIVQQKCHLDPNHRTGIIGIDPRKGELGLDNPILLVFFHLLNSSQTPAFQGTSITTPRVVGSWFVRCVRFRCFCWFFLHQSRWGVTFTPEEQEMYATVFQEFSPVELIKLLRIGQWREVDADQTLIEEGQKVDQIVFIFNGQADVLSNGQRINYLKDGAFIGEMELTKDRPSVATVKTTSSTRYMTWSSVDIKQLLIRNPSTNSTIQTIFSMDLMQKLQRQASSSIQM